ncbi:MAG: hypothetical protein JXR91_10135 [Deltaproteobacteria bacterium]|nr:hypothetical protein [Deltaproteobacteria bacterium]
MHIERNLVMNHKRVETRAFLSCLILLISIFEFGCSQEKSSVYGDISKHELYTEANDILGFENHNLWSNTDRNSDIHSEGQRSVALDVVNWTEVTSVALSSLADVSEKVSVDIYSPHDVVNWGETRIIIKIPSLSEWYRELGSKSMIGAPGGEFRTYTFSLPSDLQAKLEGTYKDLTVTVVVNAPDGEYLIDNLVLGTTSISDNDTLTSDSDSSTFDSDSLTTDSNTSTTDSETSVYIEDIAISDGGVIDTENTSSNNDTSGTDTSSDSSIVLTGVYSLPPQDIDDNKLIEFSAGLPVEKAVDDAVPPIPLELMEISSVEDFIFEGYIKKLSDEEAIALKKKDS